MWEDRHNPPFRVHCIEEGGGEREEEDKGYPAEIRSKSSLFPYRRRRGDEPWFDEGCRRAFERKQTAFYSWRRDRSRYNYESFRESQRSARGVYALAQERYREVKKQTVGAASSPRAWWKIFKETLSGFDSSIPPLLGDGGGLVPDPAGKAELLSCFFYSKQSRNSLTWPDTCHNRPGLVGMAFKSREVFRLLSELDPHGGTDPLGFFPLFFKRLAVVLAPKLSVLFRTLLRRGEFPPSWCVANVVPIPKGSATAHASDYRPISITPVLSKVFEKLMSARLVKYVEQVGAVDSRQYAYRKCLGTSDALLDICCAGQEALEAGEELVLLQLDFSAAFDRVNHLGLIHKLQCAGVGGRLLRCVAGFLGRS